MARKNTFLPNIDRAVQQLLFTNYHIIKEEETNRRLDDITGFSHPDYDFLCACL